jgi:hypothetical protein
MRGYDLQALFHFVQRPGMYIGVISEKGLDNFLIAYELGSKHECTFRTKLSNQIRHEYGIPMPSEGLIAQIKKVVENTEQEWLDLFKEESLKLLQVESDKDGKTRFASMIRKNCNDFLQEIPTSINHVWMINWYQIYRQTKEWNGKNLSKEELKLINEIKIDFEELLKKVQGDHYKLDASMIAKLESLKTLTREN